MEEKPCDGGGRSGKQEEKEKEKVGGEWSASGFLGSVELLRRRLQQGVLR